MVSDERSDISFHRRATPEREAVIEECVREWHPIDTAPTDGTTIEVRAVMQVHHMRGAKFAIMPSNWRPDTPQTSWRFTSWRPIKQVAGEGQVRSERSERATTPTQQEGT